MIYIALISAIIIILRLIYLATLSPDDYKFFENDKVAVKRADVYDRNGVLLAVSDELYSVYANPKEINNIEEASDKLSQSLNLSKDKVKEKLVSSRSFVWIKRQITPKNAEEIKKLKLNGVNLQAEYKRIYPSKRLASQILGFCDIDNLGQEGIEKSLNNSLTSYQKPGSYDYSRQFSGNDIYLTIDANIQTVAEKTIKDAIIRENADNGSLILANGKTGEILCMANYPDFDPNNYKNFEQKDFRNYSVFYQFEPGSVFKIFNIASLLDSGNLNKSDFFYCNGEYKDKYVTIKCTGVHGNINYMDIIKYSCNTAMITAGHNIDDQGLYHYLKLFGFGEKTSVLITGEQSGVLRHYNDWSAVSKNYISIGQEISVNALQIVKASTTFFNDGIMVEPLIVKKLVNQEEHKIKEMKRTELARVLKPGTSDKVIEAMKTSSEPGGTVNRLKIEGVSFAAKSGTSQMYDFLRKKYRDDEVTSSLLVYFPADDPKYIIYIVFNKPRNRVKWGGIIGAYALNEFFDKLNLYLDLNNTDGYKIKDSDLKIKREYKNIDALPAAMPDLTGLTAADVLKIFSGKNVKVEVSGVGLIYKSEPETGATVKDGQRIKLYLKY